MNRDDVEIEINDDDEKDVISISSLRAQAFIHIEDKELSLEGDNLEAENSNELNQRDQSSSSQDLGFSEELSFLAKIEAIIFAAPTPIKLTEIVEILQDEAIITKDVMDAIDQLIRFYDERGGGFRLEHVKGCGFQFQTVKAASGVMERMFSNRPRPLSRAAQETLAIIAYRQPVTRTDIEFIRGVDAGSILKNLLERGLIQCVGRREVAGRPMMFGTTDEFLRVYQLRSLDDLPPLEAFQPSNDVVKSALGKLKLDQSDEIGSIINHEHPNLDSLSN